MLKQVIGASILTLAVATGAMAQSPTPTSLVGGKVISVEEGRKLAESKNAYFIDTRSVINFGKGHVPGARTASYKSNSDDAANFDSSKDQFDLTKLPPGKNDSLVFYSDGPTGWKSYKAAVVAIKAGYKNVGYMRAGWSDWTAKGFPVEN